MLRTFGIPCEITNTFLKEVKIFRRSFGIPCEITKSQKDHKSQPVELDNSTIELHVPSRRKKSFQSYCSVDFEFLNLMQLDMTFDAKLRDDSSFGIKTHNFVSFSLLLVTFSIKANF